MNLPDNVVVVYGNEWWTVIANMDLRVSVSVPSDTQVIERVAKLLSEFDPDPTKPVYPVFDENRKVAGCLS